MNKDESTLLQVCVSYSPVSKGFQPNYDNLGQWFLASLLCVQFKQSNKAKTNLEPHRTPGNTHLNEGGGGVAAY